MDPPPQNEVLTRGAFGLAGFTTVLGVLYGIVVVLYCLCAQSLLPQLWEPDNQRQARFTLGYTSLLFFCTTIIVALDARIAQLAYINHADYSGGPLEYLFSHNPMVISYGMGISILGLITEVLTVIIQIWRLWIVWSGTPLAVVATIMPLLLLLSYIALDIPATIIIWMPPGQLNISLLGLRAMETTCYAVLSTSTILVTGLITTRLLLARRHHTRAMGTSHTSSPYLSIVAMLIESYALESAWSIASGISVGLDIPSSFLLVQCDSTIKVIAYFLVVYRVASGRGWTRGTEGKLTSLKWNHDMQAVTGLSSATSSKVPETICMVTGDS